MSGLLLGLVQLVIRPEISRRCGPFPCPIKLIQVRGHADEHAQQCKDNRTRYRLVVSSKEFNTERENDSASIGGQREKLTNTSYQIQWGVGKSHLHSKVHSSGQASSGRTHTPTAIRPGKTSARQPFPHENSIDYK